MIESEPLTANEEKRLQALKSYNILDSLPEKEYDALTRLASYICQAPISLITFIDKDRQWFKSQVGIGGSETARSEAFCHYTIMGDDILEVEDATQDDNFKNNPFVQSEPNVRFYAGAPLIDPDGHHLGALCVVDRVPRKLTAEQRDALSTLASEVMSRLVLHKKQLELEKSLVVHQDFFGLFNSSPEIHVIANGDSKIEIVSKAITKILGYKPSQVAGHSLWDFIIGDRDGTFRPLFEKAKNTGESVEFETQARTINNEMKWLGWCAVNKQGKWYASGRDITYQKKISAEVEQLSLVASKMVNGVTISDADDNVMWSNNAFERITGFSFDDVRSRKLTDIVLDEEGKSYLGVYKELISSKKSYSIDVNIRRKNGEKLWITINNSVILDKDGNIEKYIRIIIDISHKKATEQKLETMSFAARKSPNGTVIRDKDGKILWMNESLEDIIGYTFEEMEGKSFGTMLLGEKTDMSVFKAAVQAVKDNKPYEIEIQAYRKDKTPFWGLFSNSPLFNETGDVDRQVTTVVDITERKLLDEQINLLSLVASNTNSGVVINDSNGNVQWINGAFEKITGFKLDDVKGRQLGDSMRGELTDMPLIERTRELSKNKQSFEVDLLAYGKDGKPLWLSVINSVILAADGSVDKYIEVIIDITAKKKVEQELIQAKEEALQLNRAKDMFMSVMSHEMRNPLNAVIGMSHLLINDNPLESQKENLNVLKFSAENLLGLINDVLDFTKIETGNVELERADVDLQQLVKSIVSSMQYKAAEKDIYLKHEIDSKLPELVTGDSARLVQILLNLAGNAIKFTDKGGVIISLQVLEQNSKNVRIRFAVTDTGIGIASNKLGTIFESFKQAEADTTRKYGGTGLGLAITKRLIELHDSSINVESVPGKGSTFGFTVTFNKADHNRTSNNTVMELGLNINVLVVDDNQINRMLVGKVLGKWGTKVDFAENGAEALAKIEANRNYDAILMDVHMPVMGGIEATEHIRSHADPLIQQLPVIALTASMMSDEVDEIRKAGMNDFILKPFEPKTLFDKLSRYQKV